MRVVEQAPARQGPDLRRLRDVGGLWPFLSLGDLELYLIALLKTLIAFRGNRAVVHKNIGPIIASDEAVALGIVKPLNRTFHTFHVRPLGHVLFRRGRTLSLDAIVLPLAGCCQGMASQRSRHGCGF